MIDDIVYKENGDILQRATKWLVFNRCDKESTDKTSVYKVYPLANPLTLLGTVKWFGRWRQYAFFPAPNCVFEKQCLADITKFVVDLMQQRKIKKQTENGNQS